MRTRQQVEVMQGDGIAGGVMQGRHEPDIARDVDTLLAQATAHAGFVGHGRQHPRTHQAVVAAAGTAVERRFVGVVFRMAAMPHQQDKA